MSSFDIRREVRAAVQAQVFGKDFRVERALETAAGILGHLLDCRDPHRALALCEELRGMKRTLELVDDAYRAVNDLKGAL